LQTLVPESGAHVVLILVCKGDFEAIIREPRTPSCAAQAQAQAASAQPPETCNLRIALCRLDSLSRNCCFNSVCTRSPIIDLPINPFSDYSACSCSSSSRAGLEHHVEAHYAVRTRHSAEQSCDWPGAPRESTRQGAAVPLSQSCQQ